MKKILIIIFIITGGYANACDFCNCYLGLDPGYNKNTIGLRNNWRTAQWTSESSHHRIMHGGVGTEGSESILYESLVTTEVFVKYSPLPKLRLFATLPFTINTLEYEDETESRSALSDLSMIAMYQLANTMAHDSTGVRHRLFAGAGVKFPTGKSEDDTEVDIPMAHHLYSGTGSTDYIFCLSYIGKMQKLGWNVDASYKLNGESNNHYRYGNTFNLTPRLFYDIKLKSGSLIPHAGAAYEMGVEDEYKDVEQEGTGGDTWYASAGIDFYIGKISITTDYRLPVYHDMGEQMPEDKSWLFTSINFHF